MVQYPGSSKQTTVAQEEVLAGQVREMTEEEIAEEQATTVEEVEPAEETAEAQG
jgi:hypothetical protein